MNNNRLLELALIGLEAERAAVAQEIADLKTRINGATADRHSPTHE